MEGENDDDNVLGTNLEVQATVMEDENDVNFSDDTSAASLEIQNILMEGEVMLIQATTILGQVQKYRMRVKIPTMMENHRQV